MDSSELQKYVIEYQAGNTSRSELIIDECMKSDFLCNYIEIIIDGRIKLYNKNSIKFISLFIKGKVYNFKTNKKSIYKIYDKVNKLKYLFDKSYLSKGDILTEAKIIILEMAAKYDEEKGSFIVYLANTFCYRFKNRIYDLLFDELNDYESYNNHAHLFYINDKTEDEEVLSNIDNYYSKIITKRINEYDINWINGNTCSDAFKDLNILERKIIKLYYIDGLTDTEVAKKLGYRSRSSLNKRKAKIKARIDNYGKSNKLLKV